MRKVESSPGPARPRNADERALAPAEKGGARKTGAGAAKPPRTRKVAAEARRQAILKAALSVFAEHGFAAARLDDVAARAGVAKGTLYLYFKDKVDLFEALVRNAASPVLAQVGQLAASPDIKPEQAIEALYGVFEREVLGTERKLLLRLIMAEAPRFPAIAEFYYREVVSKGLAAMRVLADRAARSGNFATDAPARYPQLIVAPLLMAVIWDGLFAKIDPLDVHGLLGAYRDLLRGKTGKETP